MIQIFSCISVTDKHTTYLFASSDNTEVDRYLKALHDHQATLPSIDVTTYDSISSTDTFITASQSAQSTPATPK